MSDQPYEYDVFLSGDQDIRRSFTGHLWKALHDKGIHTFMDNSIQGKEKEIAPILLKAIEQSRTVIIVFSEYYAYSSWCLDELCKILECKEKGMQILPVFYDVDPSDVRLQKGPFGEAFERHEEKFKDDKEKVRIWRDALVEVASISGWVYRDQPEYQFIEMIVEHVFRKLYRFPFPNINNGVGIESRIQEVLSLLELESYSDGALMMGIYGPPGIGKTRLAEEICNRIAEQFEAFCFLDNLREDSRLHRLIHLQNKLLSGMIGEKKSILASVYKGALRIKKRLQQKKVLVILDDVDTQEQLEALAGKPDWFGSGSRVIVTTQNRRLLAFHGIEISYEVQPLNNKDALQLLSQHAFKHGNVDSSYTGILNELVSYASGLPLALKVVGSRLYGKSVEEWTNALQRFKRIPPYEIQDTLKTTFDALMHDEKSVLLDIACCFQGYELSTVLDILSAHHDDDYVKLHIDVLIEKSLISVNSDGKVILHPLIEDMGKDIVRQENSKQSGKRSRLWYPEDIIEVLQNNTGTSSIEMIHLDSPLLKDGEAIEWDGEALRKMNNLKTLIIRKYNKFSKAPVYLPDSLRVLEWWSYPSDKFPSDFNPNQLIICKLPNTAIMSPQESFYLSRLGYPPALLHAQGEDRIFDTWLRDDEAQLLNHTSGVPQGVHTSMSIVSQTLQTLQRVYENHNIWRIVGIVSSVVGLPCFALSPSFNRLIRGWKAWKIFLYVMFSLLVLTAVLFVNESSSIVRVVQNKITVFLVLILLALFTYYYDKALNGEPEILSLVSNAAFVLLSLSLSKLIKYERAMSIFSFSLAYLVVQLWTINWKLILVVIFFASPLFYLHSYSNPRYSTEHSSSGLRHSSSVPGHSASDSRQNQHVLDIEAS